MKKIHLIPSLLFMLLASCQYQDLSLTEEDIKTTSLATLLLGQDLDKERVEEELAKPESTLLLYAARKGWLPVVHKLLLEDIPADSTDENGDTPLHRAARGGHAAVVRCLLAHDAAVDSTNTSGRTPLHTAAQAGYTPVAELLLNNKASVNSPDGLWRSTPLHLAACKGHTAMVALLLTWEADSALKDSQGRTAFQEAAQHKETAAALALKAGRSKGWLAGYQEGQACKQQHETDKEKVHAYAEVYATVYDEMKQHKLEVSSYAKCYADHYTAQDLARQSREWVMVYAYMRADGESDRFARAAADHCQTQVASQHSFNWSYSYGIAMAEEKSQGQATTVATHYEAQRKAGKSMNWAYAYSNAKAERKSNSWSSTLAGYFEARAEPGKLLRSWLYIYAKERMKRKKKKAAEYVADGEGFYPNIYVQGGEPIRHLPADAI